jgi:hypothetical protein
VFIDPPSLDERIVNQFALLSMISSPRVQLDAWLARHQGLYRKIVIPASLKWEIRDRLDQANITERVLFPGLDGLSRWLKRYYSPRTDGGDARRGEGGRLDADEQGQLPTDAGDRNGARVPHRRPRRS